MNKIPLSSGMPVTLYFKDAFTNLFSTKLRTFLAVLGILVGCASVVAMLSGGELMTRQALLQFKELGTNLLSIQINDQSSGGSSSQKVTMPEVENLYDVSNNITLVAPYSSLYLDMSYEGTPLNGSIIGATDALSSIMKVKMLKGRFISYLDKLEPYCIVGNDLYNQMKQTSYKDPIGQQININGSFYTIIGVLQHWPQNAFVFADLNQAVIVPLPLSLAMSKYAEINSIIFRLAPNSKIKQTENQLTTYFQGVAPTKSLYFQSAEQIVSQMKKQQQILTLFLGFIGAISLLVGGIGVMNIMLVSVTERKREIGIRKAIGAKARDIRIMFLIESVMLSVFGGIAGVIVGILISFIIAEVKGWGFTLFIWPPVIGFVISAAAGIFFGYYPAYKASKLDPIQTLRSE